MSCYDFGGKAKVSKTGWEVDDHAEISCPDITYVVSGEEWYPQVCNSWSEDSYLIEHNQKSYELVVKSINKVKKWNSDGTYEMEDLESYDQYSVIIKNNGERKYYKLVETTKENLEKELQDVNKEYIEYCKNYEESRITEIRRRLTELSALGYEIVASSEELELSIVRKDGVYYNLNLEVIEKPSFEETILTFYESVLYYEYIEKKADTAEAVSNSVFDEEKKADTGEAVSNSAFDEDDFFDDSLNDCPDTPF